MPARDSSGRFVSGGGSSGGGGISATVTDTDNGYRKFMASLEQAASGKLIVAVGVHEEEGANPDGEDGTMTIIEVAEINEFGAGHTPARPSITAWFDEKGSEASGQLRDAVARGVKSGSVAVELDKLAQVFAGEVQAKIASGIPPENAESTIRKKGSSQPLIASGDFRSSIRGKVLAR